MMAMLLIPLIPIFALVTQNVILLNDIIVRKADLIESSRSVEKGDETATFIGALQQERSAALMSLFLREKFDSTQDKIDFDIDSLRIATDVALENITLWRAFSGEGLFRSKLRLQIRLDDFRKLHEARNRSLRKLFQINWIKIHWLAHSHLDLIVELRVGHRILYFRLFWKILSGMRILPTKLSDSTPTLREFSWTTCLTSSRPPTGARPGGIWWPTRTCCVVLRAWPLRCLSELSL